MRTHPNLVYSSIKRRTRVELVHLGIVRIATGVVCAQPGVSHGRVFPEARSAGGYRRHLKGKTGFI
jgi:hypothetical protein